MPVATISSKGQITLPAALRRKLRMKPHDRVMIDEGDNAIVIKHAPDLFAFEGFLGKGLPPEEERKRTMDAIGANVTGRCE